MRWSTSKKVDYSEIKRGEHEVEEVGEWYGIEALRFIARYVGVVGGRYVSKPFMYPGHWVQQMFYVKRFALILKKPV